jgi:SET domain-containing protein
MPRTARRPPLEIRESPIAGLGAFATRRIRKGTRIIEYTGERISSEEAALRYDDDTMTAHHTFLFGVDDDTTIDGGAGGNEARFINHGCAPNCEAIEEGGRIFIEAIADIPKGAELCYDYALTREEAWKPRFRKLYACRCGAPACRGTILKSPTPPRQRAKRARPRASS